MARGARAAVVVGMILLVAGAAVWLGSRSELEAPVREAIRDELELRGGKLYFTGEDRPYSGRMIARYPDGDPMTVIGIEGGLAEGKSLGYHENGQLEVDENFKAGSSDGVRTRWFENGMRRSQCTIVSGVIQGVFREWHPNGKPAVEMTMVDGKPEGDAVAWTPEGALLSKTMFEGGKQIAREIYDAENRDGG